MRVGIDLRSLPKDGDGGAGVAHAARFLSLALVAAEVPWRWVLYLPNDVSRADFQISDTVEIVSLETRRGASLRSALRDHLCDLLLVLGGSCAPGVSTPQIPWVHDLAIFDHPEWFPQSGIQRMVTTNLFLRGLRRSPHLFAVSEDTRQSITRIAGIDPSKMTVTYEGGDPELFQEKSRLWIPGPSPRMTHGYCLMIGTVEPRKNFEMIASLWPEVHEKTGRELVVIGNVGWGNVQIPDHKSVHWKRGVSDDEKRACLLSADLVCVPSWHEGFGLVALEAMQAGAPLLSSDHGALPEVVGDGGILISPDDSAAWKAEIIRLLENEDERDRLAEKGIEQAKSFSWHQTANHFIEEIKKLLD